LEKRSLRVSNIFDESISIYYDSSSIIFQKKHISLALLQDEGLGEGEIWRLCKNLVVAARLCLGELG
jgi:hypothetical protein